MDLSGYSRAMTRHDNIDSALIELDSASDMARDILETDDEEDDYFSSVNRARMIMEQLYWDSYIDVIIEELNLSKSGEPMFVDDSTQNIKKLGRLKEWIEGMVNISKEYL